MRLIWIVPKSPLGPPDGARQATASLIRHLCRLEAGVHLICLEPEWEAAEDGQAQAPLGVASCAAIPRRSRWLPPRAGWELPFTFWSFAAEAVRAPLRHRLAGLLEDPEAARRTIIVFDGLHPFAALSPGDLVELSWRCRGVVYRAHNFETALWEQSARRAGAPWVRWFLGLQAALVRAFERRVAAGASLVAPVSREDAERFLELVPSARVHPVPIGLDFPEEDAVVPVLESAEFRLLFIGRLDWIPNREGLAWFLEEVWPRLLERRPAAALHVAGTGDGRWLKRYGGLPGLRLHGRVEDLAPLYESCALSLAPIFQGSGTRVKILEAARYARASVTTALGAEGTGLAPGGSYLQAQSRREWLDLLSSASLASCRTAGLNAFRQARPAFDAGAIARGFLQILDGLDAPTIPDK